MKIFVHAKPHAKAQTVEQVDATHFIIAVKAPAKDNRANTAVAKALALHLGIAPSRVMLASGATSRRKVFTI